MTEYKWYHMKSIQSAPENCWYIQNDKQQCKTNRMVLEENPKNHKREKGSMKKIFLDKINRVLPEIFGKKRPTRKSNQTSKRRILEEIRSKYE